MDETENKPRTVLYRNFLIQITIVVYFMLVWMPILIGFVEFNIGYFIFLFISIIMSAIIILYSKIIPEQKIPISLTQKFVNLLKTMTDIVITDIIISNEHPQVKEIKDIIKKAVIWNIRDGKNTIGFDQEAIKEGENYCLDKLFPKEIGEEE